MATIFNSGVFDDGFFCKQGFKNFDSNQCNCGCQSSNRCCPPASLSSISFCSQLQFFQNQGTVTVRGNGGNIYVGTITSVQCDFFTITVPTTLAGGVPAGAYTIPCASVESITVGTVI